MDESGYRRRFSREQKMGLVFLLCVGLLTISLGALQMRNTIYGPFVTRADSQDDTAIFLGEDEKLQQIDTDRDGLNDYEELHFYSTSPYLPDTDSDGASDKSEIDRGTDPLCTPGNACAVVDDPSSATTTFGADFALNAEGKSPLDLLSDAIPEDAPTGTSAIPPELLNNPKALRDLLLKNGALTEEQLSKIDDATLMRLAKESVFETERR